MTKFGQLVSSALLSCMLFLAGCGGGDEGSAATPVGATPPPASNPSTSPPASSNRAPTIQGQAATSVVAGQSYSFQPTASDPDGDALTFSVSNLPSWASFNASTGRISGTPTAADVATYSGITITVSDGSASASLGPFAIAVTAVATGSATLSWLPPQQNTDGSALYDLAGFEVLWGRSPNALDQRVQLKNPSISTYVVENLSPGTWYFAVVAVNASGVASAPSSLASKTIS
jgi:hypothetical protein